MTAVNSPISAPHRHFRQLFSGDTSQFDVSLMNGLAGAALVSACLGQATTNALGADAGAGFSQMSKDLQESLLARLSSGDLKLRTLHTLCNGLAGTIYALDELNKMGCSEHIFERSTRAALTEILLARSLKDFTERNTDFLHGPLGVFFVLLADQQHTATRLAMDQILAAYQQQLVTDERGSRIYNSVLEGQREADEYNFGLAHGMSGHILLWTEAAAQQYRPNEMAVLVADLMRYIDHYRIEPGHATANGSHKFYPKSVIENDTAAWEATKEETYHSRLGWCYGDINIAFAKLKAGRVFGRPDWQAEGLQLARHVATRLDPVDAQTNGNAFFCHGAAGLVYMFGILHNATGEAIFLRARKYWQRHYQEIWLEPRFQDLQLRRPASFLDGIPGAVLGTISPKPTEKYPMADALLLNL